MARRIDDDELIEHWTLVGDELGQVAGKRGATRLDFSLLLKFYTRHGRFPRRTELPDAAVAYVARQVGVDAVEIAFYDWDGRTVEYHRAQVRKFLRFRECSVADADKLAAWLAEEVCQAERRVERVREELVKHCRDEGIEQPTAGRDRPDHRFGATAGREGPRDEGGRPNSAGGSRADDRASLSGGGPRHRQRDLRRPSVLVVG